VINDTLILVNFPAGRFTKIGVIRYVIFEGKSLLPCKKADIDFNSGFDFWGKYESLDYYLNYGIKFIQIVFTFFLKIYKGRSH